jgi:8-oxo-dGTP diphosphatase
MIRKSALLLFKTIDSVPSLMMVRESTKKFLLLPGGKQETGETIEQALVREITEELACTVQNVAFLEAVTGATPDGQPLTISLFIGTLDGRPMPSSEIADIVWLGRDNLTQYADVLTPITTGEIFPCLVRHNMF